MLTTEPPSEMNAEWKRIFDDNYSVMKPNRKTGYEVDYYFRQNYPYHLSDNTDFQKIAYLNITQGSSFENVPVDIHYYQTGNVLVAIDLHTGGFYIESENIEEVIPIHDDLFVYRGLDEEDIENYFLVAEYVTLCKK